MYLCNVIIVFAIILLILTDSCFIDKNLNGQLYFAQCIPDYKYSFTIRSFSISNLDGSPNYPLNFTVPMLIKFEAINSGSEIKELIAKSDPTFDVKLIFDCRWSSLPTFGLIDHIDLCYSCPWDGESLIKMEFEMGPYSNSVAAFLAKGYYGFNFHFQDPRTGTELGCLRLEFKTA